MADQDPVLEAAAESAAASSPPSSPTAPPAQHPTPTIFTPGDDDEEAQMIAAAIALSGDGAMTPPSATCSDDDLAAGLALSMTGCVAPPADGAERGASEHEAAPAPALPAPAPPLPPGAPGSSDALPSLYSGAVAAPAPSEQAASVPAPPGMVPMLHTASATIRATSGGAQCLDAARLEIDALLRAAQQLLRARGAVLATAHEPLLPPHVFRLGGEILTNMLLSEACVQETMKGAPTAAAGMLNLGLMATTGTGDTILDALMTLMRETFLMPAYISAFMLPVPTRGDGDCLLHALSIGMWGLHLEQHPAGQLVGGGGNGDSGGGGDGGGGAAAAAPERVGGTLRSLLREYMRDAEASSSLKDLWVLHHVIEVTSEMQVQGSAVVLDADRALADALDRTLVPNALAQPGQKLALGLDAETQRFVDAEFETLVRGIDDAHAFLGAVHIIAAAHLLDRAIVVYGAGLGGIYLPVRNAPRTHPEPPLLVHYDGCHFTAVVATERTRHVPLFVTPPLIIGTQGIIRPEFLQLHCTSAYKSWKRPENEAVLEEMRRHGLNVVFHDIAPFGPLPYAVITPRPAGAPTPMEENFVEGLWRLVAAARNAEREASVTRILEMFPDMERQRVLEVLLACGGSVDEACGLLLG